MKTFQILHWIKWKKIVKRVEIGYYCSLSLSLFVDLKKYLNKLIKIVKKMLFYIFYIPISVLIFHFKFSSKFIDILLV